MKNPHTKLIKHTRSYVMIVIVGLAISGITAFPLETEISFFSHLTSNWTNPLSNWLKTISVALVDTNTNYPYLSYGTDWLAFAHLMLAVLFIGPYQNPVRNKWVVAFGIICCISIIPLALIAGYIRQIPMFWRLIDCSFGIFALWPLGLCWRNIQKLENLT